MPSLHIKIQGKITAAHIEQVLTTAVEYEWGIRTFCGRI